MRAAVVLSKLHICATVALTGPGLYKGRCAFLIAYMCLYALTGPWPGTLERPLCSSNSIYVLVWPIPGTDKLTSLRAYAAIFLAVRTTTSRTAAVVGISVQQLRLALLDTQSAARTEGDISEATHMQWLGGVCV